LQIRIVRAWGWEPDPEEGNEDDWGFENSEMDGASIKSGAIDNAPYFKAISDQLWLPSCVGNAAADSWEAATIVDMVNSGVPLAEAQAAMPDLSRMFPWWNARNMMDPPRHHDASSGTYNRLALASLSMFGCPAEKYWPYDPALATRRPSITAYRQARRYTSGNFYAINTDRVDKRLEQIIKALQAKQNVLMGTALPIDFPKYESGIIKRPTSTRGRHAMVICGYDGKGAFKVRNSWSKNWGEDGYGWLSEDYIAWHKTKSLWVPTKGIGMKG
jgi:papain like protease